MNKYIIRKDCFAYCEKGCTALKVLYCKEEKCNFYKLDRNGKYPQDMQTTAI